MYRKNRNQTNSKKRTFPALGISKKTDYGVGGMKKNHLLYKDKEQLIS
jgi:hypothetical protein